MAVGVLLALVGALVTVTGTGWIDWLMPPVVAGAIVALIGLNLAPVARSNFEQAPWVALITLAAVILWTVVFRGLVARLSIFFGVVIGYVAAVLADQVDFGPVESAAWIGLPDFSTPDVAWSVLPAFIPVVLVLVAENVGHVRSVAHLTDPALNERTGRALLADGLATTVAGLGGGSGTTTYGENIGVMAATKVYSTAAYWVAGAFAIALGFLPKVGAVVNTIPPGVLGGVTTALYGLIGVIGIKIWIDNQVDFSRPANQFTAATALVVGIADFTFSAGQLTFNGIALGTVAAITVYHVMTALEGGRSARPADVTLP